MRIKFGVTAMKLIIAIIRYTVGDLHSTGTEQSADVSTCLGSFKVLQKGASKVFQKGGRGMMYRIWYTTCLLVGTTDLDKSYRI